MSRLCSASTLGLLLAHLMTASASAWQEESVTIIVDAVGVEIQANVEDRVAADEDDPDRLGPEAQQYVNQFLPMLRSEIHLLRISCDLSDDQRKAITAEGRRAVNRAARDFVKQRRQPRPLGSADPFGSLVGELREVVEKTLTSEQLDRYRDELTRRDLEVRQAAVLNLIAVYDEDLYLTAEQRDKIRESLQENWKDEWCRSLEIFQYDKQFLPKVPDEYIAPHLNEEQKRIWADAQKNRSTIYGFFNSGIFGDNSGLEPDEPDPQAPADEPAPAVENRGLFRMIRDLIPR